VEFINLLVSITLPLAVLVLTYVLTQKAERRSRREENQLLKIENILTVLLENSLSGGKAAWLESRQALQLLEIYGDEAVMEIIERNREKQYTPDELQALDDALKGQARKLLGVKVGR